MVKEVKLLFDCFLLVVFSKVVSRATHGMEERDGSVQFLAPATPNV